MTFNRWTIVSQANYLSFLFRSNTNYVQRKSEHNICSFAVPVSWACRRWRNNCQKKYILFFLLAVSEIDWHESIRNETILMKKETNTRKTTKIKSQTPNWLKLHTIHSHVRSHRNTHSLLIDRQHDSCCEQPFRVCRSPYQISHLYEIGWHQLIMSLLSIDFKLEATVTWERLFSLQLHFQFWNFAASHFGMRVNSIRWTSVFYQWNHTRFNAKKA